MAPSGATEISAEPWYRESPRQLHRKKPYKAELQSLTNGSYIK